MITALLLLICFILNSFLGLIAKKLENSDYIFISDCYYFVIWAIIGGIIGDWLFKFFV